MRPKRPAGRAVRLRPDLAGALRPQSSMPRARGIPAARLRCAARHGRLRLRPHLAGTLRPQSSMPRARTVSTDELQPVVAREDSPPSQPVAAESESASAEDALATILGDLVLEDTGGSAEIEDQSTEPVSSDDREAHFPGDDWSEDDAEDFFGPEQGSDVATDEILGEDLGKRDQRLPASTKVDRPRSEHEGSEFVNAVRSDLSRQKGVVSIAPYVRISPETGLRSMLGARGTVSTTDLLLLVKWDGIDEEAIPVSIMINPIRPGGSTANMPGGFARIVFGTRDGQGSFDCDIGYGTQFCVLASTVSVYIGLRSGFTTAFTAAASLAFYAVSRSPTVPLVYTNPMGALINDTDFATYNRPNFAGAISFEREITTGAFTLRFLRTDGNFYDRVVAANTYLTTPVLFSNDIVQVRVINNSGSSSFVWLIWHLAV